jgi:ABC-type amino acid transport substrate-binding protein
VSGEKPKTAAFQMRLIILFIFGLLAAPLRPALAQIAYAPARPANNIVTVLTDGLGEPGSEVSQILSEISIALDKDSGVRLLSINGYGGPANVRDLLQLRGTDFAVINSDNLAYFDLAKALPEARRKVRLVAPLFHQGVLLFGRQAIKSIGDLRGRKIGVPASRPSRGITARTVFGLLKIEANFVELSDEELARQAGSLDGLALYEKDLPLLPAWGVTPASHHLLPIPISEPLVPVFLPRKIGAPALAGFSTAGTLETIQVTTLLAAFDWSAKQGRYADVVGFVEKFFALVPQLRARYPESPFSRTDLRVELPGWKRFGPAEGPAAAVPPVLVKEGGTPVLSSPRMQSPDGALKVVAVVRPPLTNEQDKGGGIALKIFIAALNGAGIPVSLQWADSERELLSRITGKTADAGVFWQTSNCEKPANQSAIEAELCDGTILTDPLMQAVLAVFTRIDTPLDNNTPNTAQSRILCVPDSHTMPEEVRESIPWLKGVKTKTIRPKTLIDCLAAVDQREADGLIAIEAEARFAIEKLKLSQSFQISQRSAVTAGLHAVIAKDNPRQAQLAKTINDALAKFRAGGAYADIMASHLADLTGVAPKQP